VRRPQLSVLAQPRSRPSNAVLPCDEQITWVHQFPLVVLPDPRAESGL